MSLRTLNARLQYNGGDRLSRINLQKLRSLQAALKDDYQSRLIKTSKEEIWPCLINDDVAGLKPDYDKKIISVEYDAGLEPGDVFECLDDGTHWMIYLPRLTETAYLRSSIIRCRYTMTIDNEEYWIYFQGPTETDLRWFIKRGININELNLSGTIFIKLTPQTRAFFERFTHIKVDNHIWEVQVTDSISVPGILEIEVQEYYDNPIAELPEIRRGAAVTDTDIIIGETTVSQDATIGYYIPKEYLADTSNWTITNNPKVELVEIMNNGNMCKVYIQNDATGSYTVNYGEYTLNVNIDSQRQNIIGPDKVAPYGFYIYQAKNDNVVFSIDNAAVATILEQDGKQCKIEIITGRKGKFNLTCSFEQDGETETVVLPITIGSFTGDKNEKDLGLVS